MPDEGREQQAFHARLLDKVPGMVGYWDRALKNRYANAAYVEWFGLTPEKILGRHMCDVIGQRLFALNEPYTRAVLEGAPQLFEREIIDPEGRKRRSQARYIPDRQGDSVDGFFVLVTDVSDLREAQDALSAAHLALEQRVEERTAELVQANQALAREIAERRRAESTLRDTEARLLQSQKLEAIGRLAGGVAHDFNNLLSVILGYADLLLSQESVQADSGLELGEIRRAAARAGELTGQLLAFSRRQVLSPRVIDLNQTIDGVARMVRRILGEDIELKVVAAPELGRVRVDPGQIEQVLVNLVVNARDAMPNGGKLTIETANAELDENYAIEHPEAAPGHYVMLAVSDTGVGMDKATLSRIFEPFFTTKERGRGTGLGLATIFGIVKQSEGSIFVYSEPGGGATFKVYLPRVKLPLDVAELPPDGAPVSRGTATILLVEDEEAVRRMVRAVLERAGYRVLEAASGGAALECAQSHSGVIDLLLTDVVMPGMTGKQLAERMAVERTEMRVLYASGYTENSVVHHGVLDQGVNFLQKPIVPASLLAKVHAALRSRAAPAVEG